MIVILHQETAMMGYFPHISCSTGRTCYTMNNTVSKTAEASADEYYSMHLLSRNLVKMNATQAYTNVQICKKEHIRNKIIT